MCLSIIIKSRQNLEGFGYKVFYRDYSDQLWGDCFGQQKPRCRGKWLDEKQFRDTDNNLIIADSDRNYKKGWHIFATKRGALDWNDLSDTCNSKPIIRVKYRRGHTVGLQGSFKVIIARYMKIPKEKMKCV
jgi:hypothetical protein